MEQLKLCFAQQSAGLESTESLTKREIARLENKKRYFDGTMCGKGHVSERYVASGKCCQCKAENHKKNYEKNRERVLAKQAEWKAENKKRISDQGREYRNKNDAEIKRKKREAHKRDYQRIKRRREPYFRKNREKILAKKREYFERKKDWLKDRRSIRHKERMKNDIEYKKGRKARAFLRKSIERVGTKKQSRVSEILGYSSNDLVKHISSLLADGMT